MRIHKFIKFHSSSMCWLMALAIWGLFVFLVVLLSETFGPSSGIFLVFPSIIVSWYLGMWRGSLLAFVGLSVFLFLHALLQAESLTEIIINGAAAGMLSSLLMAGIVGKFGEVTRAHQQEILDRDRAVEQRRAQASFLTLLNDILRAALEANDMSSMLKTLVSRMGELFKADDCFITFWDEEQKLSIPVAAFGPSSQTYTSVVAKPGEHTLTASVLEAGHALVVDNPHNSPLVDPQVLEPFPDICCTLVLPLISGEKKLGAILLSFHSPRQFSDEEVGLGEMAARQVSLAITKILLLEESGKRVREFTGLFEISKVLHSPDVSRNMFGQLTETMARLVNAQICMISLYDPESGEIIPQVPAFGLNDDQVGFYHYSRRMGEDVWNYSKNGFFCSNSITEVPAEFMEFALALQIESVMAGPMWSTNQDLLGVVFIINKPGGFDQDDTRLMGIFAAQASSVIQNIQLFASEHRRNEELSVLHAIATAATGSHNEDELIEFVTHMIGQKLYPDNFGIMMLDETNTSLYLHSSYRMGAQEKKVNVPLGKGITGDVALRGKSRLVVDIHKTEDYLNMDDRIQSELCVPLKLEERVIGVVNAESARLNAFTQRDEDLLTIIAGQLATAIERLRTADAQYRQTTQLARSNAMVKVLAQVGSRASIATNPEGVMHSLGNELSLLGLMCLIALPMPDSQNMSIAYTSIPNRVIRIIERAAKRKLSDFVISRERLWLFSHESLDPMLLTDPINVVSNILVGFPRQSIQRILAPIGVTPSMPICHLPLILEGELKGVFWLWGEGLRESDLPTMSIFGSQVAIALQNAHLLAKVQKMAITDDLTGIFNRGHFFELAEHEFSRARRYELPLSAIILDIDHFKKFNDRYGHIVGDQVLTHVAQVLQNSLRDNDILGRYGGEEFSILMPVTDIKAAHNVAVRLRSSVAEATVETEAGAIGVKISVGVSELGEAMPTLLSLVNRADQAMYIAKSTGGNCVATK
jgi:diguanylate cyclase (GGDEF)-like protein